MLIMHKMEINYSKRASSMLDFAAIDETGRWHATMKPVAALQSSQMNGN